MFSKSTETDGTELASGDPATVDPTLSTPEQKKSLDPRSPTISRTPIDQLTCPAPAIAATKRLNLTTDDQNLSTPPSRLIGTQKNFLQEKLLKNLGYQAFDPRSPTQFINRTPIRWVVNNDQSISDCGLINESVQAIDLSQTEELPVEEMANDSSAEIVEDAESSIDKFIAEVEMDPRSPSVNVERTPIVFRSQLFIQPFVELPPVEKENINEIISIASNTIYQDENTIDTPITPKLDAANGKSSNNNRTPLSCLANKGGRPTVSQSNKKNMAKHPIIFIGQQQTPKCIKNGGTPFGKNHFNKQTSNGSSKIAVFKNTIL